MSRRFRGVFLLDGDPRKCHLRSQGLKKLGFETLIRSLKSHEMELLGNDPSKKRKYIALKSKGKYVEALQVVESEEDNPEEDPA